MLHLVVNISTRLTTLNKRFLSFSLTTSENVKYNKTHFFKLIAYKISLLKYTQKNVFVIFSNYIIDVSKEIIIKFYLLVLFCKKFEWSFKEPAGAH